MRESNSALNEASKASQLGTAYGTALNAILETEVVSTELLENPTPELRREFDLQVYRAGAALSFIQSNGYEEDRQLVQLLLNDYAPRLIELQTVLDARLAGEQTLEADLPPNRLIWELKLLLEPPARERQTMAANNLADYKDAQKAQTVIVLAVLILGLPVMGGLLLLIRVFERRESVANVNMERLELAALTDSLTGLGNHRAYQEQLQREVNLALAQKRSVALAVIDVDEFKEVNDSAGHARGDQILIHLGRRGE
jgi:predicted signal transduction protein with EAL and GGDEF domain